MVETSVFLNNKTQAVRLPKEVALPDNVKTVQIVAVGNARLIAPSGHLWDSFFDGPTPSEDFMGDRGQPAMQKRDSL